MTNCEDMRFFSAMSAAMLSVHAIKGFTVNELDFSGKQVPALVGTVIRVNAHGPQSPAGVTASFIAVKQS